MLRFSTAHKVVVLVFLMLLCGEAGPLFAQSSEPSTPRQATFQDAHTFAWFNTYGNIRLTDRFYWIAQTHFRFHQTDELAFVGQPAQLYNRHALAYRPNPYFQFSLGGVLRLNFNQDGIGHGERGVVPEWRIWHEYLFTQPTERMKLYHRIRIEHRWTRGFLRESPDWGYRNRFRYMMGAKIPLNQQALRPGAIYVSPEAELILQSGRRVVDSPLEDLRLTATAGYVVSDALTLAAGFMYSLGQDLNDGTIWKQRQTLRLHAYFRPDLRPKKARFVATEPAH